MESRPESRHAGGTPREGAPAVVEPLVSILVASYDNRPYRTQTLKETIPSLLHQTYGNLEILVGLDGAGKAHEAAARSFRDERMDVLAFEANRGNGPVWNDLLDRAHGEYVLFSADDDSLLPDFASALVAAMQGGAGYAFSHFYSWWPEEGRREINERCTTVNLHAVLIARTALEDVRRRYGYVFPAMRSCADMVMLTHLMEQTKGVHVCRPLVDYRRHPAQLSIKYDLRSFLDLAHARNLIGRPIRPREIAVHFAWRISQQTGVTKARLLGRPDAGSPA